LPIKYTVHQNVEKGYIILFYSSFYSTYLILELTSVGCFSIILEKYSSFSITLDLKLEKSLASSMKWPSFESTKATNLTQQYRIFN
jgi:hypothetical protein